ncbi:ribosomal-protein-alanine N-acetyltransferase [Kribbella voronezhensis]|uniref:[Ribosomal protein bS18]-alanine N-acetyltransferase n=1 Tax=Kribbella voronezhensis TaxID=2512212 RepID=A0A4R7TH69_9ACTN|nr:ribosomal protein S18-alanine N-acetyltransferase [Kribbella voronezhensis]TDU90976.1 ribosomal-protein-alanine N-acetyltransferase [Kribbella voronezhensis]
MRPNIRPANPADLPAITTLDEVCFDSDAWSAAAWAEEFARLGSDRVVLVADEGEVAGYVVLLVPGAVEDPVDLLRIAVAPAARRTGIGRQLMSAVVQRCAGRTILLEVAESNESAAALYRGFGFTEISRRRGYYAGGEDAVIMRWQEDHE